MSIVRIFALVLGFVFSVGSAAGGMIIPDQLNHSAFLYGDWKPNRANVVLFIDPLCPYCKKIIPKLDRIDEYNLYVFWSPIFGGRSEFAIRDNFLCEKPTSKSVLESAIPGGERVVCGGPYREGLRATNDAVVASYGISSVPSFYLQGRRVGFIDVASARGDNPVNAINGVVLDWERYKELELVNKTEVKNQALLLGSKSALADVDRLIEKFKPKYILVSSDWTDICNKTSLVFGCEHKPGAPPKRFYNEFVELLGLPESSTDVFVVSLSGKLKSI